MRLARLLGCTSILVLAVAASAQQAPAPNLAPPPQTSTVAPPQHPATEAQLREYFDLTGFVRTSQQVMTNMIRAQRATAAPYYPASFWDDMNDQITKLDLVSVNIPIYQEYFSEQDMAAILAFFHSPAGVKLRQDQPVIVSAAQVIIRGRAEALGKAVYLRHKDEIDAARKAFNAEHPTPAPN